MPIRGSCLSAEAISTKVLSSTMSFTEKTYTIRNAPYATEEKTQDYLEYSVRVVL